MLHVRIVPFKLWKIIRYPVQSLLCFRLHISCIYYISIFVSRHKFHIVIALVYNVIPEYFKLFYSIFSIIHIRISIYRGAMIKYYTIGSHNYTYSNNYPCKTFIKYFCKPYISLFFSEKN